MMQIGHDGYQTQWFDLFKCSKLFMVLTQPPGDLSKPPALNLQPPVATTVTSVPGVLGLGRASYGSSYLIADTLSNPKW